MKAHSHMETRGRGACGGPVVNPLKIQLTLLAFRTTPRTVLVDAVAADDKIKLSSNSIRLGHLKNLREDSSNPLSHHCDVETKKWRCYSEK